MSFPKTMAANNQFTQPLIVDRDGCNAVSLERVPIGAAGGSYDERWLQDLLFRNPSLIPTDELEPVFSGAVAVCTELPTKVGPLDLVYINEQGLLTLVECKLWRNPEARRKVVGQILDYAQEISRWSYEQLDAAIGRSEARTGQSLWEIARTAYKLSDEAAFIDRVSRHLRTGSFLLLVVGDGIRENTENIAAFLQQHAGLNFTFGLVEERLFALPDQRILVHPRILAKTVELGRFVVTSDSGGAPSVESPGKEITEVKHGRTLTEAMFIDEVAGNSALAEELRSFFTRMKERGFNLQPLKSGASLKVVPEGTKQNLMTLSREGTLRNHGCGDTVIGRAYLERLKELLPNARITEGSDQGWSSTVVKQDGRPFRIEEVIHLAATMLELFEWVAGQLRAAGE